MKLVIHNVKLRISIQHNGDISLEVNVQLTRLDNFAGERLEGRRSKLLSEKWEVQSQSEAHALNPHEDS